MDADWSAPAPEGALRDVQVPWQEDDPWDVALREKAREVSRFMPR
ncbi:hypothetical protein OG539_08685 [Actinacidiphila glaucinigra]|nr:hypothetical protein [Actinacidiphila glaucinigra]WSD63566.1 hypothetical protein OIE69_34120 [Actinacidiphila glaucinigra]